MKGLLLFIGLVGTIIVVIVWFKSYKFNKYDTVIAFTGGLGSGKSLYSVETAIKLLKKQRLKVLFHNLFSPKSKWEKPMLYSSIPVRISKKEMAIKIIEGHLLLKERIVPRSVVFIDEVDNFCSQNDYRKVNVVNAFNEFTQYFRHYTKGGYLIVNTQCSENIVVNLRRRINTVYNLMCFKRFLRFYWIKIRSLSLSEEIKTIEEKNKEDNYRFIFGLLPRKRRYDTYCYSERYNAVEYEEDIIYSEFKKNDLLQCPPDNNLITPNTSENPPLIAPSRLKDK